MCQAGINKHKFIGRRLNRSQGLSPNNKIGITTSILKCENCKLIFSNPMPLPISVNDHYDIDPFKYWGESYFKLDEKYFLNEIKIVKGLLDFRPNMKALDIGSGIGKCVVKLNESGFNTYGLEPSKMFLEFGLKKFNLNPDKFQNAGVLSATYSDNFFDFISFGAVLEHLEDPDLSLKRALKWLRPGGVLHIEIPSSSWLISKLLNFFYKITFSDFVSNLSPMHEPFHLYEFELKTFILNSKINGYKISYYEYHVCETYMPKMLDLILKPIMKLTKTGMQLSLYITK